MMMKMIMMMKMMMKMILLAAISKPVILMDSLLKVILPKIMAQKFRAVPVIMRLQAVIVLRSYMI